MNLIFRHSIFVFHCVQSKIFNMDRGELQTLTDFYGDQLGGGLRYFHTPTAYNMRGTGVGSFLGGLFKLALPLLKSTGKGLGKIMATNAAGFLDDFSHDPTLATLQSSFRKRSLNAAASAAKEAANKMRGSGNTTVARKRKRTRKTPAKKKKSTKRKTGIKKKSKSRKRTVSRKTSSKQLKQVYGFLE